MKGREDAAHGGFRTGRDYCVDNRIGEISASDLAKQLLEERASHRCSCESAKGEPPFQKRGSVSTTDGDVSLMGEGRPGDGMGGRTRHELEETSTESGETAEPVSDVCKSPLVRSLSDSGSNQ